MSGCNASDPGLWDAQRAPPQGAGVPDGPRARTILDHGQSADPTSPHFDDQGALYARGELKYAPFSRAAVRAAAVRSYHPGIER